jgi:hypothetical protein
VEAALAYFRRIAPEAEEIRVVRHDGVEFFDCGGNFEAVTCPYCAAEIDMEWWGEKMDADYGPEGFRLDPYPLPCCGREAGLDGVTYVWPQAFGRIALVGVACDIGALSDAVVAQFEALFGSAVIVVYGQH